ncbi:MAG: tetratricopeptide repeat protein [Putridiphycobacter sp.]
MLRFFILLSVLGFAKLSRAQNPVIDSLKNVINGTQHDTLKTLAYSDLCWEYRLIDQSKALNFGLNGVKLARQINYKFGEGRTLNDLSIIYMDMGKLDSAIILLNQAKDIRSDLKDELGVAAIHNKLGIIYQNQNQLEKALVEDIEALKIYEAQDIQPYVAQMKNNIGIIHFRLGNIDKSIQIHQEALDIRTSLNDLNGIGHSYVNLGNVYAEIGEPEKAISNYNAALPLLKETGNQKNYAFAANNLGGLYLDLKVYDKALENLKEAYRLRTEIDDQKGVCSTSILLGKFYTISPQKDLSKAEFYLKKALKLNQEIGFEVNTKDIYLNLAELYKSKKQVDSAFYYHDLYSQKLNEEYQINLNEKVSELQTIYETEKKDKENEQLARKNAEEEAKRKAAELQVANRNKWIVGVGFGALSIFLVAIIIIQRNKQRAKAELQKQLDEEKLKGLQAIFSSQEQERDRISKDLHDGIGQQLSGLKMAWDKLSTDLNRSQSADYSKLISLTQILDDTAVEVRNLSHQMMPKSLQELGLVDALKDMLEKALHLSNIDYSFEEFGIGSDRFNEDVEKGLYRIAQELVNNVIKHSKATQLDFQIFKLKNTLQIIVSDNGVGFSQNESSGHGLKNIKTRLSAINGKVSFQNANGTTVQCSVQL